MSDTLKHPIDPAARWGLETESVLALNASEEEATSPLDAAALDALLREAFHAEGVDAGRAAFLIAFDERADYESPNYRWFCARLPRFVYVDRIIVSSARRGQGLARQLYTQLMAVARDAGHTALVCEVNFDPPNPVSDAFHASLGFAEIGRGSPSPGKVVRYLSCGLG
jgi:hypothetical protein